MAVILRTITLGCGSSRDSDTPRFPKVKFGVPLDQAFKNGIVTEPLEEIIVVLAREGVASTNIFRKPGNPTDLKRIVKRLAEGKQIITSNYNFYTLSSVLKKFLLKIPGGVFGEEGEGLLLQAMEIPDTMERYEKIHKYFMSLSKSSQRFLALLFGTWFRVVHHSEITAMSGEALARSVTGSMFHTCSDDPTKVAKASKVMQFLIENFAVSNMFGVENIQYFVERTNSGIHVTHKFKYEYKYPSEELVPTVTSEQFAMTASELKQRRQQTSLSSPQQPQQHKETLSGSNMGKGDCENCPPTGQGGLANKQVEAVEIHTAPPLRRPVSQQVAPSHRDRASTAPYFLSPVQQKYLHNATSLSAPDVNKRFRRKPDESKMRKTFQTKSLSRFDIIKKKQIQRMRQRSNWFLGPFNSINLSMDGSDFGDRSRDTSVSRGFSETGTSDAGMSDVDSVFTEHDQSLAEEEEQDTFVDESGENQHVFLSLPVEASSSDCPLEQTDIAQISNGVPDLSEVDFTQVEERYFVTQTWFEPKKGGS
ncbi:rho GTPase-activating protein 20 isoform X2 [Lingula anatina]|uniref:Rho GTPase-activating protein 20 isoform X2 n=1 Tax=Lingula anatina TaxID=7574 RepID=A0A1S3HJG9_LINAN|nr:rho GTPase-activating protein 20 isoform X2 [Lingula anatina]|eukprot:XP_013385134.1 rho GTPase-activating protein 20 isoform X2 [Lingula anatina]